MPPNNQFRYIELIEASKHRIEGLDRPIKYVLEHEISSTDNSTYYLIRTRPLIFITSVQTSEGTVWKDNGIETDYQIEAKIDTKNRMVTFATNGENLLIDSPSLKCKGVSSYALVQLVKWAGKHFPSFPVTPIPLGFGDAGDAETARCRNALYEHLGFDLAFEAEDKVKGRAEVLTVGLLTPDFAVEGIKNISNAQCINDLVSQLIERHNGTVLPKEDSSEDIEILQEEKTKYLIFMLLSIFVNIALIFFLFVTF